MARERGARGRRLAKNAQLRSRFHLLRTPPVLAGFKAVMAGRSNRAQFAAVRCDNFRSQQDSKDQAMRYQEKRYVGG